MVLSARFHDVEVALCEEAVYPFLVEDGEQALAHRIAVRRRPARCIDGFGVAVQRFIGQPCEIVANGGHPLATEREHRVE